MSLLQLDSYKPTVIHKPSLMEIQQDYQLTDDLFNGFRLLNAQSDALDRLMISYTVCKRYPSSKSVKALIGEELMMNNISMEEEEGFFRKIWEGIKNFFKAIIDKIKAFFNWIKEKLGFGSKNKDSVKKQLEELKELLDKYSRASSDKQNAVKEAVKEFINSGEYTPSSSSNPSENNNGSPSPPSPGGDSNGPENTSSNGNPPNDNDDSNDDNEEDVDKLANHEKLMPNKKVGKADINGKDVNVFSCINGNLYYDKDKNKFIKYTNGNKQRYVYRTNVSKDKYVEELKKLKTNNSLESLSVTYSVEADSDKILAWCYVPTNAYVDLAEAGNEHFSLKYRNLYSLILSMEADTEQPQNGGEASQQQQPSSQTNQPSPQPETTAPALEIPDIKQHTNAIEKIVEKLTGEKNALVKSDPVDNTKLFDALAGYEATLNGSLGNYVKDVKNAVKSNSATVEFNEQIINSAKSRLKDLNDAVNKIKTAFDEFNSANHDVSPEKWLTYDALEKLSTSSVKIYDTSFNSQTANETSALANNISSTLTTMGANQANGKSEQEAKNIKAIGAFIGNVMQILAKSMQCANSCLKQVTDIFSKLIAILKDKLK